MTAPTSLPAPAEVLVEHSLRVIRDGQAPSGAYVAAPTYPTYGFGWLRDGAFCAYAMGLRGDLDSPLAFHRWVAATILRNRAEVVGATDAAANDPDRRRMLPTRFTLDGAIEDAAEADWPNFQLDGYGTWLWLLGEQLPQLPGLEPAVAEAATLITDYLCAASHLPCYDCWEEFGDGLHTSTRGAIVAGLRAAASYLDHDSARQVADALAVELHDQHVRDGILIKQVGDERVDASALWLALPFGLLAPDDPIVLATADRVRSDLVRAGNGVTRYRGDTFYGGGTWILLTAWLAWHELATGRVAEAEQRFQWILRAATEAGDLPEQLLTDPQAPDRVGEWVERWGPVATPLLWSHAMFLVLDHHRAALGGSH